MPQNPTWPPNDKCDIRAPEGAEWCHRSRSWVWRVPCGLILGLWLDLIGNQNLSDLHGFALLFGEPRGFWMAWIKARWGAHWKPVCIDSSRSPHFNSKAYLKNFFFSWTYKNILEFINFKAQSLLFSARTDAQINLGLPLGLGDIILWLKRQPEPNR